MNDKVFVDTNVLLYAHDLEEPARRPVALALYKELLAGDRLVISTQVLGEFFVNAIRPRDKLKRRPISARADAERIVTRLAEGDCYVTTPNDYVQAIKLAGSHQLGFWDALIIVAAGRSGAERLVSEDFTHGRTIEGVRIENPFVAMSG